MPAVLNLTVRRPIEVMRVVTAFFAGKPDVEITFEGDVSAIDWTSISGATVRENHRVAVVPLTMASAEALMGSVFPRLGLRSRIWHVIVRQRDRRLFASYDSFGEEKVVVEAREWDLLLAQLQAAGLVAGHKILMMDSPQEDAP